MKIIAAQMDLARQPENIAYIKSFLDFIAEYGYNCLVMYLEGRVKTESFGNIPGTKLYSSEEISEVVAYAASKNIEVIPTVSLFGHGDLFFKDPRYMGLAELRGGIKGRFSYYQHVFCTSLKETYELFERYLAELTALFPSPYFHAGFDETWDIGYCELCRERLKNETQSEIFSKHLQKCYDIVVGKLNKKMIIWDDMFDIYPDALPKVPRDVILCAWHYDRFLEKPAGHAGGPQFDKFQSYDELGFEYWFAPGVFSLRNVMSFTDYALGGNPSGVILTSWELERSFPHAERPVVAYGGEIWRRPKNNHEQTLDMIIKKVAGCSNDGQVSAIKNILNSKNITLPNNYQAYLRGPLGNEEYERKLFNELTLYTISPRLQELDENDAAYPVLEEIIIRSEEEALYFQLREILPNWFKPGSGGAVSAEVDALNKKIADLKRKRSEQWNKHRYGIEPCETDAYFNGLLEMIENAKQKSSNVMASLKVKFNISTSTVRFLIKYQGCSDWQEVVAGAPKASVHFAGNQCVYPVFRGDIPERMRIESSGYVGTGVVYVEYSTLEKTYVPAKIIGVTGQVYSPDSILEDGRDFCFLGDGEQAAREKFRNPALSKKINSVELTLKEQEKQSFPGLI